MLSVNKACQHKQKTTKLMYAIKLRSAALFLLYKISQHSFLLKKKLTPFRQDKDDTHLRNWTLKYARKTRGGVFVTIQFLNFLVTSSRALLSEDENA
jgi:hypothetical protein